MFLCGRIDHRRRNDTWPVVFRKIFDLIRTGIRQRHGVAAPAVKGLFKMKNLMSLFLAISLLKVLLYLPVESYFKGVFYRQSSAGNKEAVGQIIRNAYPIKSFYKFSHFFGINIRV